MPIILFNGKTYNNIEDMPANERQTYEQVSQMLVDKDGNGIPDLLEGDVVQNVFATHSTSSHITVNGKVYHTLEDLPPHLRQSVDGAFKILSGMDMFANQPPQTPQIETKPFLSQQPPSAIEEENGRSVFSWVLVGVVLCFALAVGAIAITYFLNR